MEIIKELNEMKQGEMLEITNTELLRLATKFRMTIKDLESHLKTEYNIMLEDLIFTNDFLLTKM